MLSCSEMQSSLLPELGYSRIQERMDFNFSMCRFNCNQNSFGMKMDVNGKW